MKNKIDIFHVYGGTGGSAGLYLDEIYQALNERFNQKCFVNYYFPFDYGKNLFYRRTELVGLNRFKRFPKLRLAARLIELCSALLYIFMQILICKPRVLNYNLTVNLIVELYFLRLVNKCTKTKICLTMHDVVPFETGYSSFTKDLKVRQEFINLADFLLVHNESSITDLRKNYSVDSQVILKHLFPIMDATKIYSSDKKKCPDSSGLSFIFVGHMREEKGVDILVDAWSKFDGLDNCTLTIAGNIPSFMEEKLKLSELSCVNVVSRFLTDEEYFDLICKAHFLILPYRRGTNSGIPSTALTLGTQVLCSDIEMFKNNALINPANLFGADSVQSLQDKLSEIIFIPGRNCQYRELQDVEVLSEYRKQFKNEIINVYTKLLGK